MARKTQERREALRETLINIAERTITTQGINAIKARALAQEAGCALGAIYNVFGDLNDLILSVNMRTFQRLGNEVGEKGQDPNLSPLEAMITLANAYLRFAAENPLSWRALFDVQLPEQSDIPAWYTLELDRLFGYIAAPLAKALPDLAPNELALMARALFSSVHGIVLLGLEKRISAVPPDHLRRMIALVLTEATKKV